MKNVKKRKLNYRFHDPNPTAVTASYIAKVFIEANSAKVEKAIQEASQAGAVGDCKGCQEERTA